MLASKKALLETEKSSTELVASEEYTELSEQTENHRDDPDSTLDRLSDSDDFSELYRDLDTDELASDDPEARALTNRSIRESASFNPSIPVAYDTRR